MSELKLKGPFVRLSDNSISDEDFEADAKLTIDGDWANPEHKEAYLQAVLEALNRRAPEAGQYDIQWENITDPITGETTFKRIEPQAQAEPKLCEGCPPVDYPTDKTRCLPCPCREPAEGQEPVAIVHRRCDRGFNVEWLIATFDLPHGAKLYAQPQRPADQHAVSFAALSSLSATMGNPALEFGDDKTMEDALVEMAAERLKQPQRPADYLEVDGLRVGPAWVRNKLEEQNQRPAVPDVARKPCQLPEGWKVWCDQNGDYRLDSPDDRHLLMRATFADETAPMNHFILAAFLRDLLTAAPAPERPAIQWSDELKPNSEVHYNHLIGNTPFSRILITWKGWKDDLDMIIDEHPVESAKGKYAGGSIEEAKQTAEKFYLDALKEQPNGQG